VTAADDHLLIDGRKIAMHQVGNPADIPWRDAGVDVVIEASGRFRTRDAAAAHLAAGVQKVAVSAPVKGADVTIVLGVNDCDYDPAVHQVVSNASCTTNCVAPMVKVLNDAFGIERAYMTTVHAYTNDQNLLDAPHKDARRARAAAVNIVPTTTGAARAVAEVIPSMRGRIDGIALRVPVVDGSLVDLTAVVGGAQIDAEAVNAAFQSAATTGPLMGRLSYSTEPLVSTDVIGDAASCVFDAQLTQASKNLVKVFAWYDNEWGYTARLAELAVLLGQP
jgi:glyceraldehyde 3-phosphate dehydrogenase